MTTGDKITPGEIEYSYKLMLDDRSISILAYNLETILAEKLETVLSRNIANTRPRDFYDIHVLYTLRGMDCDIDVLRQALVETTQKRRSSSVIKQYRGIIRNIEANPRMLAFCDEYRKEYEYAKDISFCDTCATILQIMDSFMENVNYETYSKMMSVYPVIDKGYIDCIIGELSSHIEVAEVKESNTALVIKVSVRVESGVKRLFIKTVKANQSKNVYHEMCMKEGRFYKYIKDNKLDSLPVPVCYDAFVSEEKGTFFIVLEDISDYYAIPDNKDLTDKSTWFSCAESLAKLHAAFWNHGLLSPSEEKTEHNAQGDRTCLQSFLRWPQLSREIFWNLS